MSSNFEKLIEYVIAGDEKKARELFHKIVVDKSRKIYEAIDMNDTERAFDDVEADHTAETELGGDEADDLQTDVFVDGEEEALPVEGEGDGLNPDIDDRVADLESEFDALKAEFEELLGAEEGEAEEESFGSEEAAEGEAEEEADLDSEVEAGESEEAEGEEKEEPVDESIIKEYVLKVTQGLADEKEEGFVQKKSPVAGKNEIVKGVTAHNLNQGGVSQGRPNPKAGELIGDKEVVNRPGRKSVELKGTPKPVSKEEGSVNKKSIES